MFFGVGAAFGSIIVAIATEYYNPFVVFKIGALLTLMVTITGCMLDDQLETNQYARMVSEEDI